MAEDNAMLGRYQAVGAAADPGALPREGKARPHVTIRHGAVDDPDPELRGHRRRVAINIRTDALEQEYARGRLSEQAYRAGRVYQRVLDRANGLRTASAWRDGDRVDAGRAGDLTLVRALDAAAQAVRLREEVRPIIGLLADRILALTLGEGLTLTQTAERLAGATGGSPAGRHAAGFYAWAFRQALEALGAEWHR
jgi:hypothetical protein